MGRVQGGRGRRAIHKDYARTTQGRAEHCLLRSEELANEVGSRMVHETSRRSAIEHIKHYLLAVAHVTLCILLPALYK